MGISLTIIGVVTTALFFRLAAEQEDEPSILWVGASLGLWAVSLAWLQWGFLGGFGLQVGLFLAMTIRNMVRR